jgi:hypothetical protein
MTGLDKPLGYFRKSAKALLGAVRSGDMVAQLRACIAFRDADAASFTLMQAEHVVAVEHGFECWADLHKTDAADLYAAISRRRNRRKYDLPTQERLRQIFTLVGLNIPKETLRQPIHFLSLFPITGGIGASAELAMAQAKRNAERRAWDLDIGHFGLMVEEHQALRIKEICSEEGIPFWERRCTDAYLALTMPDAFRGEYDEICKTFGVPVPAFADNEPVTG